MAPNTVEVFHEEIQICESEKSDSRAQNADDGSETELLEPQEEKQLIRRIDIQ
jgi:hypothetical protein